MSDIVESILRERYYHDGESSWEDIVNRVVEHVMGDSEYKEDARRYMLEKKFIPNSPTLMNAGNELGCLSACFVLPIDDDMSSIGETLKNTMLVHQRGGGTGFNFGALRSKGSLIKSTGGEASGPVSFMKVYDSATDAVKQGGKRRGANMGILPVWHDDIDEFIDCKKVEGEIANFNISVMIDDDFMKSALCGELYNGKDADAILNHIAQNAWNNGEPGIVFYDTINADNSNSHLGVIDGCNPCSEQPLMSNESCTLASIDISKFITEDGEFLQEDFEDCVKVATIFLNYVLDANKYPIPEIEEMSLKTRKIGLGLMGFADALIKSRIVYGTQESIELAEEWSALLYETALDTSMRLAERDGVYPAWEGSTWDQVNVKVRNSALICYAPTGTISQIAECSSGIEPNFSYVYDRYVLIDNERVKFRVIHPIFDSYVMKWYDDRYDDIMDYVYTNGTITGCPDMDEDDIALFKTSRDLTPKQHIDIQAAFQINCDAAISKTINCDNRVTVEDVKELIIYAWKSGCKGLTVYRDGSREMQVISTAESKPVDIGRPPELFGITYKRRSGCGKLFVTVNERNGEPYEVFVQTSGHGGCAANSEALGRMISIGLRNGVSAWEIKKQLSRVKCNKCNNGNIDGKSCADIIGKCLYPDMVTVKKEEPKSSIYSKCPFCGEIAYVNVEGCGYCTKCGESKCQ